MEEANKENLTPAIKVTAIPEPELNVQMDILQELSDGITIKFTVTLSYEEMAKEVFILDCYRFTLDGFTIANPKEENTFVRLFKPGHYKLTFMAIFNGGLKIDKEFVLNIPPPSLKRQAS
ncbi:MAG: hypothetical protein FWE37_05495 [Spirochaetaceae bacterium]|nr:hypothetical protein [Spirochaetaceae bacterium]